MDPRNAEKPTPKFYSDTESEYDHPEAYVYKDINSKKKERDYVKEAMVSFNLETKMRELIKKLIQPYLERENFICNETDLMKMKCEKYEKKFLHMDLLEDRILYLERVISSINNRLTIWDNDFHQEKSNTSAKFESQMLFNAEIQNNMSSMQTSINEMSYKISGFYDDFLVLSQKFLDTKTEIMEGIVDIKYSSNYEIEELKSQAREFESKLNTVSSLDENNKTTIIDACSDLEMLKLEIGKVNNAISSSALNNLLRPEFDSRLQQFSLDMKIIESKIQKSNSEMNALNKDQSKSLSDAIELMNLGLTYIAHPLSSTKSALLSLFPSSSDSAQVPNSCAKMIELMCEAVDRGLKEKQITAERDLELRKAEIERHKAAEQDSFSELQKWAIDRIKEEVKKSLEAEYAQFKEESEKGQEEKEEINDSESDEMDEEVRRMDIKTPVHTLGVVTANGNQTSVSELKEQNIERSVQELDKESRPISQVEIPQVEIPQPKHYEDVFSSISNEEKKQIKELTGLKQLTFENCGKIDAMSAKLNKMVSKYNQIRVSISSLGRRFESEDRIMLKMKELDGMIHKSPTPKPDPSATSDEQINQNVDQIPTPQVQIPDQLLEIMIHKSSEIAYKKSKEFLNDKSVELKKEVKLSVIKLNEENLVAMQGLIDKAKILSDKVELDNKEIRFDLETWKKHCQRDKREVKEIIGQVKVDVDQIKSDINKRIELDESDFHTARKSNAILEKIDERTINIINESNSTSSRVEHNFETIYQSQEFKNKSIENEFMKLKNERYHKAINSSEERNVHNNGPSINTQDQLPSVMRINQFKKKVNESLMTLRKKKVKANIEFNLTPDARRNNEKQKLREMSLNEVQGISFYHNKKNTKPKALEMNFAKLKRNRKMLETISIPSKQLGRGSALNTANESYKISKEIIVHKRQNNDIDLNNSVSFK